jgi:hypothetical protein
VWRGHSCPRALARAKSAKSLSKIHWEILELYGSTSRIRSDLGPAANIWRTEPALSEVERSVCPTRATNQADPRSRVAGPRMNPSVDVGRPPRPFRHLRMAERRSPDLSSSRAPVHSALVQKSVTRHHQPCRPAFNLDARQNPAAWQEEEHKKLARSLQPK